MKNLKRTSVNKGFSEDKAFDGGGVGLIVFVATAIWLLLFQSNGFR